MLNSPEKLYNRSRLTTPFALIIWCSLVLSTPVFGQEPHIDNPSQAAQSMAPNPLVDENMMNGLSQDLPAYQMARDAAVLDQLKPPLNSPSPAIEPQKPTSSQNAEMTADTPIVPHTQHQPRSEETFPPEEILAVQTQEPEEVEGEREDFVEVDLDIDFNDEVALPTQVKWSPMEWNRLELETAQEFETSLANPLQRYEPIFQHDRQAVPDAHAYPYGNVPLVLNRHVERNLNYFQSGIPDRFQGYLDRYEKYKALVERIFVEFGLPPELGHLSLVESGFNPRAYSRARASGPWQFMKATGRMYGLKVNWYVDERRDPVKSTIAAAHHLRDLYDRFGSWPLALGAYNAGGGKVSRAIRRSGSRDFWKIRRTWYIRRETKEYVPRFIAATLIASHPEDYGFSVNPTEAYAYDEVLIHKRVHLKAVAKTTGITFEELRELNPELRRSIVPSVSNGYALKVPSGMGPQVEGQHDLIQPWTQPPPPPTQWYRVRYGDSLSVVARRHRMTVGKLKRLNNLSGNLIRVGDRLRVRAGSPPVNLNAHWYTVRQGDSLSEIAHKFGTTAQSIRNLNNLSGHLIRAGDKLRVRGKKPSVRTGDTKWYRVRRGDSLWSIAKQFSVSVTDLRVLNNLTTSVIRAGHMLLVSQ